MERRSVSIASAFAAIGAGHRMAYGPVLMAHRVE